MECSGRAVWPPLGGAQKWVYNPLIARRKMATRDAFAGDEAQAHLQALMAIVSREYHMPRPLTHEDKPIQQTTSSSTTPSSRSATSSSSSSSATSTLALTTPRNVTTPAPAKPTQTPGGKRREHPDPSPNATPSPKPKSGRQSEHDFTAQASQQQPATTSNIQPATTSNIQQPEINNKEESDESEEETEETTQETELTQATTRNAQQQPERKEVEVQPTTNNFKMRDFQLQERVRDGGGRSIINDPNNKYLQYRDNSSGDEWQLSVGHHGGCGCPLFLYEWERSEQFKCQGGCGKMKRRGNAKPNAFMAWRCERHGMEICPTCIPVVVRTLDVIANKSGERGRAVFGSQGLLLN